MDSLCILVGVSSARNVSQLCVRLEALEFFHLLLTQNKFGTVITDTCWSLPALSYFSNLLTCLILILHLMHFLHLRLDLYLLNFLLLDEHFTLL